jgi:hypothetical protein
MLPPGEEEGERALSANTGLSSPTNLLALDAAGEKFLGDGVGRLMI